MHKPPYMGQREKVPRDLLSACLLPCPVSVQGTSDSLGKGVIGIGPRDAEGLGVFCLSKPACQLWSIFCIATCGQQLCRCFPAQLLFESLMKW